MWPLGLPMGHVQATRGSWVRSSGRQQTMNQVPFPDERPRELFDRHHDRWVLHGNRYVNHRVGVAVSHPRFIDTLEPYALFLDAGLTQPWPRVPARAS